MRIAVIADIHGNLGALDAVIADIARRAVDLTVNLGDVVSGPLQPCETADRLMNLGMATIRGNHERQLLTCPLENLGESDRFAASQLRVDQRVWLAGFPDTLVVAGDVFLCHGTPLNDVDYFLHTVDETGCRPATLAEVEQRAAGCAASLIVCGHTHLPGTMRLTDGRVVMNPGSVGLQAYPAKWPHSHTMEAGSPHARYAVAERVDSEWRVELIKVVYEWESAARLAVANGRADWAVGLRTGRI